MKLDVLSQDSAKQNIQISYTDTIPTIAININLKVIVSTYIKGNVL